MPSAADLDRAAAYGADLAEARRVLNVCTVCGYCDGLCEVFAAAEAHPDLDDATVVRLAHLCHACRSCAPACQFASPHPFAIDVPIVLSRLREGGWRSRPGIAAAVAAATVATIVAAVPPDVLFAPHLGPGAFERIVPLGVVLAATATVLVRPAVRLGGAVVRAWRALPTGDRLGGLGEAIGRIATMRDLDGGGGGCSEDGDRLGTARRWAHLLVLHGFLLAFAATAIGAIAHHGFGVAAPYPLASLPVGLGTLGGVGMVVGAVGLILAKARSDPALDVAARDFTLPVQIAATAASGLAVLALRDTAAMGSALAIHLGLVLGFFATLADGRFAHVPHRAMAVWHAAIERRARRQGRAERRRGTGREGG